MDEVVTRRILIEEFERMFDAKFDEKFDEKFDKKFDEKFQEVESNLQRYMGALSEDFTQKVQMLAEGITMQIEVSERKWHEHLALHGLLDKRINRLEAEVLTS